MFESTAKFRTGGQVKEATDRSRSFKRAGHLLPARARTRPGELESELWDERPGYCDGKAVARAGPQDDAARPPRSYAATPTPSR